MKIAVIYIRPIGGQFDDYVNRFTTSYLEHDAGIAHDLVIAIKDDKVTKASSIPLFGYHIAVGEGGFDIGPFLWLARMRFHDYDRVVLLGTYSRILADDWLSLLCKAGLLASATGSWEEHPHLRTNAFSIAPHLLDEMAPVYTRQDCLDFEFGSRNIYQVCRELGVEGVVAGRDGGTYTEDAWRASRTFRFEEQENLIVADKRTDHYANASESEREYLELLAWGNPR